MPRTTLTLGACAALAVSLAVFPLQARAEDAPVSDVMKVPRPAGGEYFGLYILGKKVGYQFIQVGYAPGGKDKVRQVDNVTMRANVGGKNVERIMNETRIYESKPNGKLLSFVVEQHGDGGDQVLEGSASAAGVRVIRKRPGLPNEILNLKPARETVEDADQVRVAVLRKATTSGIVIDTTDLQQYRVTTTLLPPLEIAPGGVKMKLQRTSTVSEKEQVPVECSLAPDGGVFEIKFGTQLISRAEPEAVAKRMDMVELFTLVRVVLPRDPPPAAYEVPGKMTLVMSKLPARFQRDTERQKFKKLPGDLVEVSITAQPPSPDKRRSRPLADPSGGDNLKANLSVESDKREVKELARKVVGDEKDAYAAAEKISRWVYDNVKSTYGFSADRTTDVMRQMKGDCTEHALLAVSLMRAAGIPAKRIDGVIYQKGSDGVPALMWHEWVAAFVGEWVQLDPTWGQPIADATHFAVGEETGAEIAPLIGELRITDVR
jgi:transglutaminase superfamily protein